MTDRVLSTQQAKQAITELQRIINGDLMTQLNALNQRGKTLSDPNVWDGRLAQDFRNNQWPQIYKALQDAQAKLEELRTQIERINQNIMTSGGNP